MVRRPGEFDTFLFADYSGAASTSAQRRAIALWRLDHGRRPRKVEGPFTRETLREELLAILARATREGRRCLFGIDHQWSWPRDLWAAAGFSGRPWREALAALVEGEDGRPPLGPAHVFPAAFNAWAARADLATLLDLTSAPAAVQEAARGEGWILGGEPGTREGARSGA